MPRSLAFPTLNARQLGELQTILRSRTTSASLRQRSELVWLLAGGASLAEASEWVDLHYTNAHLWVKRFLQSGVAGLSDLPKAGRPRQYDDKATTEILKAAAARPKDLGLKFTTWSLPKIARAPCAAMPVWERSPVPPFAAACFKRASDFGKGKLGARDPEFEANKQNRRPVRDPPR